MHTLDDKSKGKSLLARIIDKKYDFNAVDTSSFSDIEKEVFTWCKQVSAEMKDMNSTYISFPGDLVLNNIGERDNGEIIFFDI